MRAVLIFLSALVGAALPASAQSLSIFSGNGQVVYEQFQSEKSMVVRAADSSGRPLAGVSVTWSVTQGQGNLIGATNQTDANGFASTKFFGTSLQLGTSYFPSTVTATSKAGVANFVITTVKSRLSGGGLAPLPLALLIEPASLRLTGTAGSTLPSAVLVQAIAQSGIDLGKGVPNVGVTLEPVDSNENNPTAVCDAPSGTALTDAQGFARCNIRIGSRTGTAQFYVAIGGYQNRGPITLTVTPGLNCNYSLSPTSQTIGANGGAGSFQINTAQGCAWTGTKTAQWITLTSSASGIGMGTLSFSVAANPGPLRTGIISVGGQNFSLTQNATGSPGGNNPTFSVPPTLPAATANLSYSVGLNATGGTPPYRWTANGTLPAGLSLNSSTGVLGGVATTAGTYSFGVTVSDAANGSSSQTFSLTVTPGSSGGNLTITTTSFPNGTVGIPYQQPVTFSGGCSNPFSGPPQLTLASGALPTGLTLQPVTGGMAIGGTPAVLGMFPFALRVADSCGASSTRDFSITIAGTPAAAVSVAPSLLNFTLTQGSTMTGEQTLSVSSSAPTQFQASVRTTDGATWLSVSPQSGATPATLRAVVNASSLLPGDYTGTITVAPSANAAAAQTVQVRLTVAPLPALRVAPGTMTFSYQSGGGNPAPQPLSITSNSTPITFSAATSGEAWLSLSPATGTTATSIQVNVNPAGLSAGNYVGSILITPDSTRIATVVTVSLNVGSLPVSLSSVTNAASFLPGGIAPGEFVTIFGNNFGPETLVGLRLTPEGKVDTTLADTRVLFDGVPAPLVYVSATQLTAIVPYSVSSQTGTRIEVENQGRRSAPTGVAVVPSAPGIFTIGATNQAAALNQDSSVNGPENPAEAGTVVSLYATGEGVTTPPGEDGSVTPSLLPLPRPLLPVTVAIGGENAEILYAGAAPGMPAGVLQINARVPTGIRGNAPVVLTVGERSSQANAVVSVQ